MLPVSISLASIFVLCGDQPVARRPLQGSTLHSRSSTGLPPSWSPAALLSPAAVRPPPSPRPPRPATTPPASPCAPSAAPSTSTLQLGRLRGHRLVHLVARSWPSPACPQLDRRPCTPPGWHRRLLLLDDRRADRRRDRLLRGRRRLPGLVRDVDRPAPVYRVRRPTRPGRHSVHAPCDSSPAQPTRCDQRHDAAAGATRPKDGSLPGLSASTPMPVHRRRRQVPNFGTLTFTAVTARRRNRRQLQTRWPWTRVPAPYYAHAAPSPAAPPSPMTYEGTSNTRRQRPARRPAAARRGHSRCGAGLSMEPARLTVVMTGAFCTA